MKPAIGALLVLVMVVLAPRIATAGDQADEVRELTLAPGEQKTLPGEGVDAISTGAQGVVDVRVTDDQTQVLIVGLAPGTTTVLLLMLDGRKIEYRVTVSGIKPRRNVRIDVYYVQLTRRRGLNLGLAWPGSIGLDATGRLSASIGTAGRTWGASTSIVSQVLPRLDIAASHGWAKVMQHARIVAANGEESTFATGGELHVRISSGLDANLEKIQFGTTISARAAYDEVTKRIEVEIDADISTLGDREIDGLPSVDTAKVKTTVNLELGQSIALGGLSSDSRATTRRGLPLLGQIPVLGYLFSTRVTTHERIENVVFIVPSMVAAVPTAARDRVQEALDVYRRFHGETSSLDRSVGDDAIDDAARLDEPAAAPAPAKPSRRREKR